MSDEPIEPNDPNEKKNSPERAMVGLFLAFVPSIFFLCLKDVSIFSKGHGGTFWFACDVSIVCCFVSSSLLFRHKAGWAIIVGILFFLLNAIISFMLGCGAVLTS